MVLKYHFKIGTSEFRMLLILVRKTLLHSITDPLENIIDHKMHSMVSKIKKD
jgi:hypothetical protein